MSRWRVVSARRSPASIIAPPVSSRSPHSGAIASRQGNSAAESIPSVIWNGDSLGMRPVLTRLGAALCPSESSVGPRPALHLSSRVHPRFVMLLADCPLLEDCRFDEMLYCDKVVCILPRLDAPSVYTCWVAPRRGRNEGPASGSVGFR